jgi:hypothetical protein
MSAYDLECRRLLALEQAARLALDARPAPVRKRRPRRLSPARVPLLRAARSQLGA